ncbi:MAG: hypothetical protein V4690_04310 [Patescibacteria group bacterium]
MINLKNKLLGVFLFGLFLLPVFAGAVNVPNQEGGGGQENPKTTTIGVNLTNPVDCGDNCTIMSLITLILKNVIMPIAAVAVVLWIIWAGFTFITAQGKPAEIEKAKQRLLWSLVGAGILLGATAISEVVQRTVESLTK